MALSFKTSPTSRPERTRYYASRHLHRGRGAECRNFSRLPARGGAFSLDILFYRTKRFRVRIPPGEPNDSHFEILSAILVNDEAEFAGKIGSYCRERLLSAIHRLAHTGSPPSSLVRRETLTVSGDRRPLG